MAGKNRGKLGIGLPNPDLSKNWGGLPDLDLDPTRPDFCQDIIPLEISRPYLVSMLAFYSDNPNLNPLRLTVFFCKCVFEKKKNKQKEAGVGPFQNEWQNKALYLYTVVVCCA